MAALFFPYCLIAFHICVSVCLVSYYRFIRSQVKVWVRVKNSWQLEIAFHSLSMGNYLSVELNMFGTWWQYVRCDSFCFCLHFSTESKFLSCVVLLKIDLVGYVVIYIFLFSFLFASIKFPCFRFQLEKLNLNYIDGSLPISVTHRMRTVLKKKV